MAVCWKDGSGGGRGHEHSTLMATLQRRNEITAPVPSRAMCVPASLVTLHGLVLAQRVIRFAAYGVLFYGSLRSVPAAAALTSLLTPLCRMSEFATVGILAASRAWSVTFVRRPHTLLY